jgi:hypothetical protein
MTSDYDVRIYPKLLINPRTPWRRLVGQGETEKSLSALLAQAERRSCLLSLRLAMKAARRLPRAHGMTVSSLAAAATMPLMKRVLVFMGSILDVSGCGLVCPLLEDEYDGAIGPVFGRGAVFQKNI